MYNKKLLIILVIFSLIFSVGVVSASESNETSYLGDSFDNTLELTDLNQNNKISEDIVGDELSEDNSLDIYVDENGDGVNGNGTMDNPFTTLAAAQNSEYKEIVNVNIFEGTYTLGSRLYFDTSNLNINGLGSNVVIKNLKDDTSAKQTISLVNANNGNLTMSNIILDASGWHRESQGNYYFTPFLNGAHNTMRFNNCTFIGYNSSGILHYASNNGKNSYNVYEFNGCKFINYTSRNTRGIGLASQGNVTFVNCVFSADIIDIGMVSAEKVIFDSCWFGLNSIDKKNLMFYDEEGVPFTIIQEDIAEFTRYAIFNIYENYLGDNKYEIIGKLTWNGTNDTDGIDKLCPMIVYLSADNGIIPETATLENGMFKVEYATESTSHEITARLDKQIIKLNNSVNFNLTSPIINYGDIQNITVYFQDNVKGTVYVTVNNKTYREFNDEQKVKVVSIGDILPVGTHDVVVKFESDNENDVITLGFNTTAISVNKITPKVNISREGDLVPGEKLIVKVEVPYATENVTIMVNGDKNTTKLVDNAATYTIDELAQGTYYVTVLYAGDNICDFAYATDSFDVVKSTTDLINDLNNTIESQAKEIKDLNATVISQAEQIDGLNATVISQASTIESQKEQIVSLNETVVEQNKTINKASNPVATNILVKDIATTATTAKYFIISLVDVNNMYLANKTVKFTVNGKTDSVVTNGSGVATVKASYSTAGTRYYTFSFLGETGYGASIASAKVVVSKKATKLTAPKKTFKVNTKTKKVQVKLTSGKTVLKNKKVTLKVKGKTYTAKTNKKGIATFKITKLTKKGTSKYTVKFAGDKAYKAVNKNGKITIK